MFGELVLTVGIDLEVLERIAANSLILKCKDRQILLCSEDPRSAVLSRKFRIDDKEPVESEYTT